MFKMGTKTVSIVYVANLLSSWDTLELLLVDNRDLNSGGSRISRWEVGGVNPIRGGADV